MIATVIAAAATYLGIYLCNISLARRHDQLARVNAQLRELHEPLLALPPADPGSSGTWRRRELPLAQGRKDSSEEERQRWHGWIRTVLQPRNTAMAELMMKHADLIDETQMPPSLVALCTNAQYYEALRARWDEGDFERYIPYLVFPAHATRKTPSSKRQPKHTHPRIPRKRNSPRPDNDLRALAARAMYAGEADSARR